MNFNLGIRTVLLQNCDAYGPEPLGTKDILILDERIAAVEDEIAIDSLPSSTEVFDVAGRSVVPGYIDYHNHLLGGGGGTGLPGRVPPIQLSGLTTAGITTVVGCLGFDTLTRGLEGLLALVLSLEEEGISTFMYSGGTSSHPIVTLTGSIARDMLLVEKVVGPGEVSLSEMGPNLTSMGPGATHIAQVAGDALTAGRLTGKSGLVNLQIPRSGLAPLFEIVERTGIDPAQFVPSHSNQSESIFEEALAFGRLGGWCDFSSSYLPPSHPKAIVASAAVMRALDEGIPIEQITMSTDGNGGYPIRDERGRPIRTHYLDPATLHERLRDLVQTEGLPLDQAVRTVSTNVAVALQIADRKGHIAPGADADLVVLDEELHISDVHARGRVMVLNGSPVVTGVWER